MKNPEGYPTGEYNKLVRDKIPQRIRKSGEIPVTHIATGEEYIRRVKEKLKEEISELLHAPKEKAEEKMGDIIEILHAYAQISGTEMKTVESKRQAKHTTNGGFQTRVVLERVEKP